MRLSKGILRPGKVLQVCENGEIKGFAPGLFSSTDAPELLPPIYPFYALCSQHSNAFSKPKLGDDIWILNLLDNQRQLYWFRRDDFKTPDADLIKDENVEILCNKSINEEGGYAQIYFNDGTGWMINNNGSFIQIDPNGNINITNPKDTVMNTDGNIYIGTDASRQVARGPETTEVLNQIKGCLKALSNNYISLVGKLTPNSGISTAAQTACLADGQTTAAKITQITKIPDINEPNTFIR